MAFVTMPFFGPFLGGQVEQHHRHVDVDEVGGDLRAHHAGAEHGDLAHVESVHRVSFGISRAPSFDADPGLRAAEHRHADVAAHLELLPPSIGFSRTL